MSDTPITDAALEELFDEEIILDWTSDHFWGWAKKIEKENKELKTKVDYLRKTNTLLVKTLYRQKIIDDAGVEITDEIIELLSQRTTNLSKQKWSNDAGQ